MSLCSRLNQHYYWRAPSFVFTHSIIYYLFENLYHTFFSGGKNMNELSGDEWVRNKIRLIFHLEKRKYHHKQCWIVFQVKGRLVVSYVRKIWIKCGKWVKALRTRWMPFVDWLFQSANRGILSYYFLLKYGMSSIAPAQFIYDGKLNVFVFLSNFFCFLKFNDSENYNLY